jgi:hypothetical protein
MEGLLFSVSQAIDAEISVPAEKRGMEELCGLEVQSPSKLVEQRRSKHV